METNKGVVRYKITDAQTGQRLDNFLLGYLKGAPRSLIYRLLRKGQVRVNGGRAKPFRRLEVGDEVRIPPVRTGENAPPAHIPQGLKDQIKRSVIYESDEYVGINKPGRLAVHSGSGVAFGLIDVATAIAGWEGLKLAHRLDRDTSGCLLLAQSARSQAAFQRELDKSVVTKRYHALLEGNPAWSELTVDQPLSQQRSAGGEKVSLVGAGGKPAITRFQVLERYHGATLVDCQILTGRTHQIRAHAQFLSHSIVGDRKYGGPGKLAGVGGPGRQFLHCHHLQFAGSDSEDVLLHAPLSDDLSQFLKRLVAL